MSTQAGKAELVDLTTVSLNFPESPANEIQRDNILDVFDRAYDEGIGSFFIEGPAGSGKTTILSQYARRHRWNAISLFVSYASATFSDCEYFIGDLCSQIEWILGLERAGEDRAAESGLLRRLSARLQRHAKRKDELYYFVLDGLDELPNDAAYLRDEILRALPVGLRQFKFLFSGGSGAYPDIHLRVARTKSTIVPFFSLPEAAQLFTGVPLPTGQLADLQRYTGGLPGRLADARRILAAGEAPSNIFDVLASHDDLRSIEWRRVEVADDLTRRILALLAFYQRPQTTTDVALILGVAQGDVESRLGLFRFVRTQPPENEIHFISPEYQAYTAERLSPLRQATNEAVIAALYANAGSPESAAQLPRFLSDSGRDEELVHFLSPEYFAHALERSGSPSVVRRNALLGLNTADKIRKYGESLRFALQAATCAQFDEYSVSRDEIFAHLSMGSRQRALDLALAPVLVQDRLRLLAAAARFSCERGLTPEPELLEQIEIAHSQTNISDLGSKAEQMAADLMFSNPELAIKTVQDLHRDDRERARKSLAMVSAIAVIGGAKGPIAFGEETESSARIPDRKASLFLRAAAAVVRQYSGAGLIAEAERIPDVADRIFLLKSWAEWADKCAGAVEVLDYALNLIVGATPYSPNASDLRRLAQLLRCVEDLTTLRRLVGLVDAQRGNTERAGPTEEYVRLQLYLAEAELRLNQESAKLRVIETWCLAAAEADLSVKAACMATMKTRLAAIDPGRTLETPEGLHTLAAEALDEAVGDLLGRTADHLVAVQHVIETLAVEEPGAATNLAKKLNTEPRRDAALRSVINAHANRRVSEVDFGALNNALKLIADPDESDEACMFILDRVNGTGGAPLPEGLLGQFEPILLRAKSIREASLRSNAACLGVSILLKCATNRSRELEPEFFSLLDTALEGMHSHGERASAGFFAATELATTARESALRYLKAAEEEKARWPMCGCEQLYVPNVDLAILALGGLVARGRQTKDDVQRLSGLIEAVPDLEARTLLWAKVAMAFLRNGRTRAEGERIAAEHVKPLLSLLRSDIGAWERAVVTVCPALYAAHPPTATDIIDRLSAQWRALAYQNVLMWLITGELPWEPFEAPDGKRYEVTWEKIVEACNLLERTDVDARFYVGVRTVAISASWSRSGLSREQQADLKRRLKRLIDEKLPAPGYIAHDGYKVLCDAHVAALAKRSESEWAAITERAYRIPNTADRAMVISMVAALNKDARAPERESQLAEARRLTKDIPSLSDKIDRYRSIAQSAMGINRVIVAECLRDAFRLACAGDRPEVVPARRRLVDLAYRYDPELANQIASELDDDPARAAARREIDDELKTIEFVNSIGSPRGTPEPGAVDVGLLSRSCWRLLGSLNSGSAEPARIRDTMPYLKVAIDQPLSRAYPIFAWVIQNASQKVKRAEDESSVLRPMFESMLLSCQLAARLGRKTLPNDRVDPTARDGRSIIVRAGEREDALGFMRGWMRSSCKEYLKICDPYFGIDDLELLQIVSSFAPAGTRVDILTSMKHQSKTAAEGPLKESFRRHWRMCVSNQSPPDTRVVVVGVSGSNQLPIHDRWWLTKGGGLRIGTSFSSLGKGRECDISVMDSREAEDHEREMDPYLHVSREEYNGASLEYEVFKL